MSQFNDTIEVTSELLIDQIDCYLRIVDNNLHYQQLIIFHYVQLNTKRY